MTGQTGRATAGTLVARSRRPAHATAATAVLRLTGGTSLATSPGPWAPAVPAGAAEGMPVPASPASPAAPATRGPHRGHPTAASAPADTGLADTGLADTALAGLAGLGLADTAPGDVPATSWRYERGVKDGPGGRGGRDGLSRPSGTAPAAAQPGDWGAMPAVAGTAPTPLAGSAVGPLPGSPSGSPSGLPSGPQTGTVPGRNAAHAASPTSAAVPAVLRRVSGSGPAASSGAMPPSPLVARVRRPALSAATSDPAGQAAASTANGPVTVAPLAPEPASSVPAPAVFAPQASHGDGTVHPPVTIGEIHVHVAEPARAGADPLALLAPYARGLTARRDGAL